ncbi:membrane-bound O-acyltransferase family protein [Siphonobacter sp. BAB-5405]|nr:membrane-bound O-acyltransferase family protein [Siphonobacter sp. BAB-5405]
MLFNSYSFVLLVLLTFGLYYLPVRTRAAWQLSILILSSLFFYGYYQPLLVLLLLGSVTINIISSYLIIHGAAYCHLLHSVWGVVANLSILIFFKYSSLFAHTFLPVQSEIGSFLLNLPLPIGISFFTFQGISLIVDTYRNRNNAAYRQLIPKSIVEHSKRVLFFKAFFPQLVSGPIVKAHFFLPQIEEKFLHSIRWEYVFKNLTLGYFFKMVIADNLKDHTSIITYPYFEAESTLTLLIALFGYSMQIFADFAGYSLIALGLAALFGYQFPINFNFPYISTSFSEFWRRWHISLSSFLREYLYIPLGGNRKGEARTCLNLFLTMVLGGLWHGAAWSYAVWGAFHGLALLLERYITTHLKIRETRISQIFKGGLVFSLVTLGWLLFKLPEFSHVVAFFKALTTNYNRPLNTLPVALILLFSMPVIAYHIWYVWGEQSMERIWVQKRLLQVEPYVLGCMLFMIITNSGSSTDFIYFQF